MTAVPFAAVRRSPKQVDISKFTTDAKLTIPARAAALLDWAAEHYPMQFVAYNVLLKGVMGYGKMPRLDTKEVEQLRAKITRIREILMSDFGRELVTMPGSGCRATVDSADTLKHNVTKRIVKVRLAKQALAKTASLVDPSKVPNTEEYKALKSWFNRDVHDVLKTLTSPEFERKLLVPGTETAAKPGKEE